MSSPSTAIYAPWTLASQVAAFNSPSLDLQEAYVASIQLNYGPVAYTSQTFAPAAVNVDPTDTISLPSHGYASGLDVQFSSTGTLPGGLSAATDYFVRVIDANTIAVYDTQAHALGTTTTGRITLTSQGTGTHTITPQAFTSATAALFGSNDNVNFVALTGQTVTISASGTALMRLGTPDYRYVQMQTTAPSKGGITITAWVNIQPAWNKTV